MTKNLGKIFIFVTVFWAKVPHPPPFFALKPLNIFKGGNGKKYKVVFMGGKQTSNLLNYYSVNALKQKTSRKKYLAST